MLYGGYFCAIRGTQGTLASTGLARNGANGTALGFYDGPDPAWAWAADYAGACAVSLRADPGVPLQYLTLNVKAPPLPSRFIRSARNTLLYDGISTFRVNAASQVELERAINFYQTNAAGAADNSFLDVETNYGLMFLIRDMQNFLLTQFPRKKLVADGTRIPPGSSMVSPTTVKTAVIARYRRQCLDGYAQQPDTFAANIVAVDAGNGALQLLLPFVLVNQLRQIPMLVQFTKP
jgi:phage tail sheath gpL-like